MVAEKQWRQVKVQNESFFKVVLLLKYTTLYMKIYFPQT